MATVAEVREALDITSGTWNKYIADGVVTKPAKKSDGYNIDEVSRQIIRFYRGQVKTKTAEKMQMTKRITKLEKELASYQGGEMEGSPEAEKKKLDVQINRQKLIKMKHENSVRKKEYMPVDNVFSLVTSIASEFAAFLDPIAGQIKQLIPDMNARTHNELEKTLARGRNNLARHIEGKTVNELISLFDPEKDSSIANTTDDS